MDMLTSRGRMVRVAVAAVGLALLLAGTLWGQDDDFPVGPFRMYATAARPTGNVRTAELWGVRPDEVRGKSLLNLDIGLPIQKMRDAIRACIAGSSQLEESVLEATNRRGKNIRCRVTVRPLSSRGQNPGAILLMDEVEA